MFPIICQIGPLKIYSFGLMLAIAAIVCTFLASCDAKEKGISSSVVYDLFFWVTVGGVAGARIFFILLNFDYFFHFPSEILMIQNGGLAWQGGLLLGTAVGILFCKRHNLPLLPMMDLVAPYAALGQAIGRLGCFLNGCCYGKEVPWGIYFPVHHEHLHPTQLYCSFGLLTIFFVLKYFKSKETVPGKIFILYLFMAAWLRFAVEFFRADHDVTYGGLSIFQIVSLIILCVVFYANLFLNSRSRQR